MLIQSIPGSLPVPISFVGSGVNSGSGAAGTHSYTLSLLRDTAGAQPVLVEGDFIVVCHSIGFLDADITGYISAPGSDLTKRHDFYSGGTFKANLLIYDKFVGAVPDTELILPNSGHVQAGHSYTVHVFRGVDPDNPYDVAAVSASATGSSQPNAPSITPATQGAWIVATGAGADNAAVNLTNPAGMSATTNHFRAGSGSDNVHGGIATALKTNWASGAFDPAAFGGGVSDASNNWVAATMALRPKYPGA